MEKLLKLNERVKGNQDLILISLIGIFIRIKDLVRYDFWYDEAFTGLMTKIPWKDFQHVLKGDIHPPLYLLSIRAWANIFGSTDLTIRIFSLTFGILTLFLIFSLTKDLYDKKTALITLLLAGISPFLCQYSYEARSYSLFSFFVLLSFYFAYKKKGNLFSISLIMLTNIHFMGLLFIPGLLIAYLYFVYGSKDKDFRNLKKRILPDLFRFILILTSATILLLALTKNHQITNIEWARKTSLLLIPQSFISYLFGIQSKMAASDSLLEYKLPVNILFIGYTFFTVFVFSTVLNLRKVTIQERIKDLVVLLNLFLPQIFLISYGLITRKNLYIERYLIPASLFLFVYLGVLLVKARFETMAVYVVIYVFILFQQSPPDYYKGMKTLRRDLQYISNQIVFTAPMEYIIGKYYLYEQRDQLRIRDFGYPDLSYTWWPFIGEKDHITEEELGDFGEEYIFVIPNRAYVPEGYNLISAFDENSDYNLYKRDSLTEKDQ